MPRVRGKVRAVAAAPNGTLRTVTHARNALRPGRTVFAARTAVKRIDGQVSADLTLAVGTPDLVLTALRGGALTLSRLAGAGLATALLAGPAVIRIGGEIHTGFALAVVTLDLTSRALDCLALAITGNAGSALPARFPAPSAVFRIALQVCAHSPAHEVGCGASRARIATTCNGQHPY